MAKKEVPTFFYVCENCLVENPRNFKLFEESCVKPDAHGAWEICVWKWPKYLEIYPSVYEKPVVRPQPINMRFSGNFKLCHHVTTPKGCRLGERCNHAHSVEEMEKWNAIKSQTREQADHPYSGYSWENSFPKHFHHQRQPYPRYHTAPRRHIKSPVPQTRHETQVANKDEMRCSGEEMALLSLALSQSNYKQKLKLLLDLEQVAHEEELKSRCDGKYTLFVLKGNSERSFSFKNGRKVDYEFQAYLTGLDGDQISYATQASRSVTIEIADTRVHADILPRNYSHTEEKLYLGIESGNRVLAQTKLCQVNATFKLKHEYFDRLRDSVGRVPDRVVSRIVPDGFPSTPSLSLNEPLDLEAPEFEDLSLAICSSDQIDALNAMPRTTCSKREPPFLLTGPFGSGKTRLLALAAHISFRSFREPMHLLVCVQQHVSAGAFLSCFNDLATAKDVFIVQVVTEKNKYSLSEKNPFCRTVKQLQEMLYSGQLDRKKVMIIATCSTANNLLYKKMFRPGYFSHIYIDEGAQMREPEAVAPLGFATEETILVLAGDQHQVGPAMLVLGEKPQKCGLAVSLVERLDRVYTEERPREGQIYHRALTTNFRCHPEIMKMSGDLFYKTSVTCKIIPHAEAPFPFHFVCSEVDDVLRPLEKHTFYDEEAKIVAEEMVKFSKPGLVFPLDGNKPDFSQFAFASPCRSQLSIIERYTREHEKLRSVNKVPIYDIQGNEYRALFLSTTEPTKRDGSTLNPTKSICDPFVFNTVISRARLVVVSVGNPFTLLRKETHMVSKYGDKAKCWSTYLKLCLDRGTISAAKSLKLTEEEWKWKISSIRGLVGQTVESTDTSPLPAGSPQEKVQVEEATGENKLPLERPQSSSSDQESPASGPDDTQKGKDEEATKIRRRSSIANSVSEDAKFTREFKVTSRLGKGGYGVVYGVKNLFDEREYAVKIIKLNPQSKKDIKREVRALASLNHPRIVRYYSSWTEALPEGWQTHQLWADLKDSETYTQREMENKEARETAAKAAPLAVLEEQPSSSDSCVEFIRPSYDTTRKGVETNEITSLATSDPEPKRKSSLSSAEPICLFIQTELCERGTLRDWLTDHTENRPREKVLLFTKQILEAVVQIHKDKLIHRDLKPSNILFEKDIINSLKVGDFGLVVPWEKPAKPGMSPKLVSRTGGKARSHTANVGTELYRSPEQKDRKDYNSKVDIFALGLIFFELNYPMITGHQMNKVFNDLRKNGKDGLPPDFVRNLPNEARLTGTMVDPNPDKRPTAEEILGGEALQRIENDINLKQLEYVPFSS